MLTALRSLAAAHLALLRAEASAIARDGVRVLLGLIVVTVLAAAALLLALAGGLAALEQLLLGTTAWVAPHLAGLCAAAAGWTAVRLFSIEGGRRAGLWLAGALTAALTGALLSASALLPAREAAAAGLAAGLAATALACAWAIGRLDRAAFAARFYPHASEAQLRATLAELEERR
jgi:hypothetical protein